MKILGSITICGQPWKVCEGDTKDQPELSKAWGLCDPSACVIWLDKDASQTRKTDTLVHECLHAMIACSGAGHAIVAALPHGVSPKALSAWEETFVRVMTPHVLALFGKPKISHGGS